MSAPPSGRYRRISLRMYADARYRRLSDPQPCGKSLWHHLLFGPHTGIIPGVSVAGEAQLAETLKWDVDAFRHAFAEVKAEGLARADWEARLVWVPNALRHNPPQSANVIRGWREAWLEVPECEMKVLIWQHFKAITDGMDKTFRDAFRHAFGDDMPEPGTGTGTGDNSTAPTVPQRAPALAPADAPPPKGESPQQEAVRLTWNLYDRFEAKRPKGGVIGEWRKLMGYDTARLISTLDDLGPRGKLDSDSYVYAVIKGTMEGNGKVSGNGRAGHPRPAGSSPALDAEAREIQEQLGY